MAKQSKQPDLPVSCPLCGDSIEVTRVKCNDCGCEINANFKVSGFIETVPLNILEGSEIPMGMTGAITAGIPCALSLSELISAITSDPRKSTDKGRCGPCASSGPMGNKTMAPFLEYASVSR